MRDGKMSRLYLSMQLLADAFDDQNWSFDFFQGADAPRYTGLQVYSGDEVPGGDQIFFLPPGVDLSRFPKDTTPFVTVGLADDDSRAVAPHIVFPPEQDFFKVLNCAERLLQLCHNWEATLGSIVNEDGTLYDLCCAGIEFFHNPLYIHDSFFNILAQPQWVQGMLPLQVEDTDGKRAVPLDLINDFKLDQDYIKTLDGDNAQIWDVDQVCYGMRSLYVNIWDQGKYRARVLLNELQTPLQKSHFYCLEYFGEFVKLLLRRDMADSHGKYMFFEDILKSYMTGESANLLEMRRCTDSLGWKNEDDYLCLKLRSSQRNIRVQPITTLCSAVDVTLKCSVSFFDNGHICTLVNLTRGRLGKNDCSTLLASLIRESLLYCGESNPFTPIFFLDEGFRESEIALRHTGEMGNTDWYLRFSECAVDYLVGLAGRELHAELFCAPELTRLRRYDEQKGTEYYQTLQIYLENKQDLNAAAKALFIHRTTLQYRLDKIANLVSLELDNMHQCLYYLMSFRILEQEESQPHLNEEAKQARMPEQMQK